jgi:hypothetical protein
LPSSGWTLFRRWRLALRLALVAVALVGSARVLPAQDAVENAPRVVSVQRVAVGFDGAYKVGEWTSLRLDVDIHQKAKLRLSVICPDADDNTTVLPGRLVELAPGKGQRLETCFHVGRIRSDLTVRIEDAEGSVLHSQRLANDNAAGALLNPAMRLDVPLWVNLARLPAAPFGNIRVVDLSDPGELPADPRGYESIEMLILPAGKPPGETRQAISRLSAPQAEALRAWVQSGGHLLLSLGGDTSPFDSSPLKSWVPVSIDGDIGLRQLINLENFSGQHQRMQVAGSVRAAKLVGLSPRHVKVNEAGNPLVATVPYGLGRVTLLAINIEAPPLSAWPALPGLLMKLAGIETRGSIDRLRESDRQLSHVGITDLATQLLSAQENFSQVARPSYWWVMGLILVYLAVVGPIDFLIVHRRLGRPALTWVTFPLLVLGGGALAVWGAGRINGTSLLDKQLDVLDHDLASGHTRVRSWYSVYSAQHERMKISVQPASEESGMGAPVVEPVVRLRWFAAPENSIGGLYRSASVGSSGRRYDFAADSTAVENLPVLKWSTKTLQSDWEFTASKQFAESNLESGGPGQISGTLKHHLPESLDDAMLVIGNWVHRPRLRGLEPGELPARIEWLLGSPDAAQRELKALITDERRTRRQKGTDAVEYLSTSRSYDRQGRNRVDLMTMISFHQRVGGSSYTGLANAALRSMEMLAPADVGFGVLVGHLRRPSARVSVDGSLRTPDEPLTYVRIVVPVRQGVASPSASMLKPGDQ